MRHALTLAGFLAFASIAAAPLSGQAPPVEAPGFEARAGDLHVIQLWSDDQERLRREWTQALVPNLTTTNRIERNKPIHLIVAFEGCRPDAEGNCNLTGSIEILDPDGLPYGSRPEVTFWDNQPAPPPNQLVPSPRGLGLVIEDGEKLGDYTVRVTVTDMNANVTARTEDVITAVEAGSN